MNKFICPACFPKIREIGEVLPTVWLGLDSKTGKYVLICSPGHKDSFPSAVTSGTPTDLACFCILFHVFKSKPTPDPLAKRPKENHKAWEKRLNDLPRKEFEKGIKWADNARSDFPKISIDQIVWWMDDLKQAGWRKRDGFPSVWIHDRAAKVITGNPRKVSK